ncbi:MAG: hypothetical protein Kow0099_31580 [Candidatus Abyssubacteria bacterium]
MGEQEHRLVREKGLRFFGRITASLSHEINNVIAIVGELSGLLDDLLLASERGKPIPTEKLRNISEKIRNQVKKGESVIKRLNRFAHSIDEPVKQFDLRELMQEVDSIAQRFAVLKEIRLETNLPDSPLMVNSNPFRLQHAIFTCLELALDASAKEETVSLTFERDGEGAKILTTSRQPLAATKDVAAKLSFLSILMEELGGTAESRGNDSRHTLTLSIPKSISAADQ